MKLRLVVPGQTGLRGKVFLDGVELRGVTDIRVEVGVDKPNRASITLLVSAVEVEAGHIAVSLCPVDPRKESSACDPR
jgi:hypothetical protein